MRRKKASRAVYDMSASTAAAQPAVKPKKRFRFLRWTWRITYLSVIAGAAQLAGTHRCGDLSGDSM